MKRKTSVQISRPLRARGWASMARGTELETDLPRRRMPPGIGGATLTWQSSGGRWWVEGTMLAATKQDRLSDADIGDARIGASRTPASIAAFFNGTAVDRGLVRGGVLLSRLARRWRRCSRACSARRRCCAMYTETPGLRRVRRPRRRPPRIACRRDRDRRESGDKNYRIHGSGVDEPGINLMARLRAQVLADVDATVSRCRSSFPSISRGVCSIGRIRSSPAIVSRLEPSRRHRLLVVIDERVADANPRPAGRDARLCVGARTRRSSWSDRR